MEEQVQESPRATLEDLISRGEKEIVLSNGKSVKIRRITVGDLSLAYRISKTDFDKIIAIVQKGLVEPKITLEQAKQLNPKLLAEISDAIIEFSGYGKEEEIEAKNLLDQMKEEGSSV